MDDAARLSMLANRAAEEVADGMTLGLGSGSTAEAVVRALGKRVAAGLRITGVPTSERTATLARSLHIPLLTLDEVERLDLGIDGADEIAPNLDVVKGRGGALLHEKLVALACDRYLIVAASDKLVAQLGTRMPLPVEVIPLGWRQTAARLTQLGLQSTLRIRDSNPFISDGGHYILDCTTGPILDTDALDDAIKRLTGVVDHGLFIGLTDQVLTVNPDGVVTVLTTRGPESSS